MMKHFIPVASPDIGKLEEKYVLQALRSTWVSSIGEFVSRFEHEFASFCEVKYGVSVSNGTNALFLTLRALGVGPGDEIIVPALTFVAVPAVVLQLGANPVIVDIDPVYWCIDPKAIERAITKKTKAIIVVHVYGHPSDMDPILELARAYQLKVIEDCAEAHGARYKDHRVGSIGDAGCFSFYGNKIITTGEGGMVVSRDSDLLSRIRFLKDHAMDPNRRYYHSEVGYNSRMTNIQAALGCAQLDRISELIENRAKILEWYREYLADIDAISLNPNMSWAEPVNWMVCAVLNSCLVPKRGQILSSLREKGVDSRPFFVLCQDMPPYNGCRTVGVDELDTPVARRISLAGFNLPSSASLKKRDIEKISNLFKEGYLKIK